MANDDDPKDEVNRLYEGLPEELAKNVEVTWQSFYEPLQPKILKFLTAFLGEHANEAADIVEIIFREFRAEYTSPNSKFRTRISNAFSQLEFELELKGLCLDRAMRFLNYSEGVHHWDLQALRENREEAWHNLKTITEWRVRGILKRKLIALRMNDSEHLIEELSRKAFDGFYENGFGKCARSEDVVPVLEQEAKCFISKYVASK